MVVALDDHLVAVLDLFDDSAYVAGEYCFCDADGHPDLSVARRRTKHLAGQYRTILENFEFRDLTPKTPDAALIIHRRGADKQAIGISNVIHSYACTVDNILTWRTLLLASWPQRRHP